MDDSSNVVTDTSRVVTDTSCAFGDLSKVGNTCGAVDDKIISGTSRQKVPEV